MDEDTLGSTETPRLLPLSPGLLSEMYQATPDQRYNEIFEENDGVVDGKSKRSEIPQPLPLLPVSIKSAMTKLKQS